MCEARRVEAGGEQPGIADIFTVTEYNDGEMAESSETGNIFYRNIWPSVQNAFGGIETRLKVLKVAKEVS